MDQSTHCWLAVRAIALLEDSGEVPELVKLLKPFVRSAAIGSWIPDLADSRRGGGDIDNHVFKLKPYQGAGAERFVVSRKQLLQRLGSRRRVGGFIRKWGAVLDDDWWSTPYRADPPPGQHLANRTMALTTTLIDQLILGDSTVERLVPGEVRFADRVDPDARTRAAEVATYFFMLSHFVADACQPCHSDARVLSAYSSLGGKGPHKKLEVHWAKGVGGYFEKNELLACTDKPSTVVGRAREVDGRFGIEFDGGVPDLRAKDAWAEVVTLCRASFAVASIFAPKALYPYGAKKRVTFDALFTEPEEGPGMLEALSRTVMHDGVLNIAMVWRDVWKRLE